MEPTIVTIGGVEYPCRLRIGELEGLQAKTDFGPELLLMRLQTGEWNVAHLREIIRFGLIGGGMQHVAALKVVGGLFEYGPYVQFKVPAMQILAAALYGPPDDQVGESEPEPTPAAPNQTESGGSAPSTP
ncbi:gene transfer agent family protein [Paracoccus sulfuroxidans]|uniref:Tail tube GTA-gp10-like protein n=1 Tax=Paracoccus sulfuroxidans TaxID=384678 RepID=A0A562NCB1_9RHOB|nr:gene transfer agent family protein [Paracoccus sulfuroxidans]TWI29740.1 tail tube GTA-gp10-like protein [Paracoccus sulfuroxidans]